jgi:hypothetical protein
MRAENGYLAQTMRPVLWVAMVSMVSVPAAGAELACSGASSAMGCFDAAPLSGPAEPSPFHWFGRGQVLELGHIASTVVLRYASSPAELIAPSADPAGRLVPVVRHTTRLDLRLAIGLGRHVDLTLTQPTAINQAGSGPDALTTQSPPPLASSGFGDSTLSIRTRLPESLQTFAWAMRLEMTLPLGNERAYLGNRDLTEAIAVNAHWAESGFSLVTDLGLRVSRPTRFGDITLGTHAFWGLGVDYAPLQGDWLHVSLEGLIRPNLVRSPKLADSVGQPTWVMPAEWMASVSSRPLPFDLWFSFGGGTGVPLSHRDGSNARVDAAFIAPSTPRYQLLGAISVRY